MTPTPQPGATAPVVVVDVAIEAGDWPAHGRLAALCEAAVAATMEAAGPAILGRDAEISVLFTDDRHVRALNRRYRNRDLPTNVLSFPASPPRPGEPGPMLGDVVLARETIVREAAGQGLTPDDHTTHLIVHGLLHLLGYDHESEEEAGVMEGLETAILDRLGIADPYG